MDGRRRVIIGPDAAECGYLGVAEARLEVATHEVVTSQRVRAADAPLGADGRGLVDVGAQCLDVDALGEVLAARITVRDGDGVDTFAAGFEGRLAVRDGRRHSGTGRVGHVDRFERLVVPAAVDADGYVLVRAGSERGE
ncbi:hypothetical protein DVK01_20275 [Haloarcula sp. Atlit-120R]|nr:hypothetical protein DVK01_20275 [Haloarcula sp. Atlit-120R]